MRCSQVPAPGSTTLGIPSTPGVPEGVTADTIVCGFNDVDGVAAACARYGEGLAAIVVEPIAGNMGVVPPAPGSSRRSACSPMRPARSSCSTR